MQLYILSLQMPQLGFISLSRKHLVILNKKFQNTQAAHVPSDEWLK